MREPHRSIYRLTPDAPPTDRPFPAGLVCRPVADNDDEALGRLMEHAYAGTIDEALGDNSDGAVEVASWRAAGAVPECSVVAVAPVGALVAATMVFRASAGDHWIAYVFTRPEWKGRGLAAATTAESLRALRARHPKTPVLAGVTDGNTPSERLLASLGFRRIGPA